MKKLTYVIVGFIIGAVLTYYFCPRQESQGRIETISTPKNIISITEATELSKNYEKNNPIYMDSTNYEVKSKKKIQSVYWTLENVEEYLAYAKQQSDSLGYSFTGLRVYFANYGNDRDPSKKNQNTLFIAPTGFKLTSKANSMNILSLQNEGDTPIKPLNDGTGGGDGYPQ